MPNASRCLQLIPVPLPLLQYLEYSAHSRSAEYSTQFGLPLRLVMFPLSKETGGKRSVYYCTLQVNRLRVLIVDILTTRTILCGTVDITHPITSILHGVSTHIVT